jgi:SnoaL-like domain
MLRALVFAFACVSLAACSRPPEETAQETPPEVQRLLDENEIVKIAAALDGAVDRKDWALARSFFEDEVEVDFSSLGGAPSRISAAALVGNWQTALTPEKQSFHLRGDATVDITGDTATMTSHGYAWNRLTTRKANDLWEVWGVYEHRFTRTAQGWRIGGMKFVKTYERGDPAVRSGAE